MLYDQGVLLVFVVMTFIAFFLLVTILVIVLAYYLREMRHRLRLRSR